MKMITGAIALCLCVCACGDKQKAEQAALQRFAKDADLAVRLNPAAATKDNGLTYEGIAGPRFRIADTSATEIGQLSWLMTEIAPRMAYQFKLDVEKTNLQNAILRLEVSGGGEQKVFDCALDAASGAHVEDKGEVWSITCPAVTGAASDTLWVRLIPAAKAPADQGALTFRRLAFNRRPL